jgi:hypothetical protein
MLASSGDGRRPRLLGDLAGSQDFVGANGDLEQGCAVRR